MIGEGRRKGMEDVVGEGNIPILIAKESVKLAHGGVLLFITPSELAVLEMYLFKITSVDGVSKTDHPASIAITPIFVACFVYLVEVSRDQPTRARRRLRRHKLGKESIL